MSVTDDGTMVTAQAVRILPDYQNKGVSFYLRSQGIQQTLQKVPTLKLFSLTSIDANSGARRKNDPSSIMFMRYVSITVIVIVLLLMCSSPRHPCRSRRNAFYKLSSWLSLNFKPGRRLPLSRNFLLSLMYILLSNSYNNL